MRLKICVNDTFEEEKALVDLNSKSVLLRGDYYHDKIDEKIEGFLLGLDYCKIEYELLEDQNITPNMEIFQECDFYNDDSEQDYEESEDDENDDNMEDEDEAEEYEKYYRECEKTNDKYIFLIDHDDSDYNGRIYTQDILEAIDKVRNCEGDLYDGDKLIYSCLGFGFGYNCKLVAEYGVQYDDELGFVKITE